MAFTPRQKALQEAGDQLHDRISEGFKAGQKLAVIKAPPGSGKTFMLLRIIGTLVEGSKWQVAIATQTNTQADDLIEQAIQHDVLGKFTITRLAGSTGSRPAEWPDKINWVTKVSEAPMSPGLIVSTAAKWATVNDNPGFDLFAIDEAWQMKWADMMRCSAVSSNYLLIGDPGQIPPVTQLDVSRWGTSARPPHKAVPEVVLEKFAEQAMIGSLPSVRRLPKASVPYVKPFYDFDFDAFAEETDRVFTFSNSLLPEQADVRLDKTTNQGFLECSPNYDEKSLAVVQKLASFEPVVATLPTPVDGPPSTVDKELAIAIKRLVRTLLETQNKFSLQPDVPAQQIEQSDIGVTASHRAMNGLIRKTLGQDFPHVRIDTPERWQGLQKPFMIAVHPLSGANEPSDFDLGTGRLCVMASRHQIGLIFVTRDHVPETLANTLPFATQAPGQPDETGRGRKAHVDLFDLLAKKERIVSML